MTPNGLCNGTIEKETGKSNLLVQATGKTIQQQQTQSFPQQMKQNTGHLLENIRDNLSGFNLFDQINEYSLNQRVKWIGEQGSPLLAVIRGPEKSYAVTKHVIVIGRETANHNTDLVIEQSSYVSRCHLLLYYLEKYRSWSVKVNGKNGILINDKLYKSNNESYDIPLNCIFRFPSTSQTLLFRSMEWPLSKECIQYVTNAPIRENIFEECSNIAGVNSSSTSDCVDSIGQSLPNISDMSNSSNGTINNELNNDDKSIQEEKPVYSPTKLSFQAMKNLSDKQASGSSKKLFWRMEKNASDVSRKSLLHEPSENLSEVFCEQKGDGCLESITVDLKCSNANDCADNILQVEDSKSIIQCNQAISMKHSISEERNFAEKMKAQNVVSNELIIEDMDTKSIIRKEFCSKSMPSSSSSSSPPPSSSSLVAASKVFCHLPEALIKMEMLNSAINGCRKSETIYSVDLDSNDTRKEKIAANIGTDNKLLNIPRFVHSAPPSPKNIFGTYELGRKSAVPFRVRQSVKDGRSRLQLCHSPPEFRTLRDASKKLSGSVQFRRMKPYQIHARTSIGSTFIEEQRIDKKEQNPPGKDLNENFKILSSQEKPLGGESISSVAADTNNNEFTDAATSRLKSRTMIGIYENTQMEYLHKPEMKKKNQFHSLDRQITTMKPIGVHSCSSIAKDLKSVEADAVQTEISNGSLIKFIATNYSCPTRKTGIDESVKTNHFAIKKDNRLLELGSKKVIQQVKPINGRTAIKRAQDSINTSHGITTIQINVEEKSKANDESQTKKIRVFDMERPTVAFDSNLIHETTNESPSASSYALENSKTNAIDQNLINMTNQSQALVPAHASCHSHNEQLLRTKLMPYNESIFTTYSNNKGYGLRGLLENSKRHQALPNLKEFPSLVGIDSQRSALPYISLECPQVGAPQALSIGTDAAQSSFSASTVDSIYKNVVLQPNSTSFLSNHENIDKIGFTNLLKLSSLDTLNFTSSAATSLLNSSYFDLLEKLVAQQYQLQNLLQNPYQSLQQLHIQQELPVLPATVAATSNAFSPQNANSFVSPLIPASNLNLFVTREPTNFTNEIRNAPPLASDLLPYSLLNNAHQQMNDPRLINKAFYESLLAENLMRRDEIHPMDRF